MNSLLITLALLSAPQCPTPEMVQTRLMDINNVFQDWKKNKANDGKINFRMKINDKMSNVPLSMSSPTKEDAEMIKKANLFFEGYSKILKKDIEVKQEEDKCLVNIKRNFETLFEGDVAAEVKNILDKSQGKYIEYWSDFDDTIADHKKDIEVPQKDGSKRKWAGSLRPGYNEIISYLSEKGLPLRVITARDDSLNPADALCKQLDSIYEDNAQIKQSKSLEKLNDFCKPENKTKIEDAKNYTNPESNIIFSSYFDKDSKGSLLKKRIEALKAAGHPTGTLIFIDDKYDEVALLNSQIKDNPQAFEGWEVFPIFFPRN